jgi:hypothetical protein
MRDVRDEEGNIVDRVEAGNYERFVEMSNICSDCAGKLAPFQSPKLAALAIARDWFRSVGGRAHQCARSLDEPGD